MNPIEILKSVVGIALMLAIAWLAWNYIDDKKQLSALQAVIEQADSQAHEQQKQQEQTFKEVEHESNTNRDILVAYYDGLLRDKSKTHASANAKRTTRPDAATTEPMACERNYGFEKACALDAMYLGMWQKWAIENHIPIE